MEMEYGNHCRKSCITWSVVNISGKKVMLMTSVAVMMLFTNSRDDAMAAFHRLMPESSLSR